MNLFLLNLFLALLWCALSGSFALADLTVGLVLGALVIGLGQRGLGHRQSYVRALLVLLGFCWFAIREIVLANIALAKVLLSRDMRLNPVVVPIPLEPQSPGAITTLANLITLTPGTITLDASPDGSEIYVHNLTLGDEQEFVGQIKQYERRVLEAFNELREHQPPITATDE
jgi:multicomponent Na+:H+ antiporter subunit E